MLRDVLLGARHVSVESIEAFKGLFHPTGIRPSQHVPCPRWRDKRDPKKVDVDRQHREMEVENAGLKKLVA